MNYLPKFRFDYFEKDIEYIKDNNDFTILLSYVVFGGIVLFDFIKYFYYIVKNLIFYAPFFLHLCGVLTERLNLFCQNVYS